MSPVFRRPSRKLVLTSLLLIGAGLALVGEITARVLGFGNPPLAVLDDRIEYYLVPDREYRRFGKLYKINRHSMRGDEVVIDPRSRSSTYSILGDSVVYGSGIDQSETVTWQLRQSLAGTRSGAVVQPQVLNIAASSWGPENILRFYERFGPFPGDTAWIVQSTHDMTDVLHQKHELVPYRTSAPLGALHDIIVAVARQYVPTLWGVAPETRTEAAMRAEADAALVALMARLREDYARVVLVFHATRDEALQNAPSGELHFKEHAARAGVDFLSTTEAYRRAYGSGDPPHYDSIHLSKSGALLLSRLLQSSLAPAKQ